MIIEEQRERIFTKTGGECYYCGKQLAFYNRDRKARGSWEIEHLVAKANGGDADHPNNLVPSCWECNLAKGTGPSRAHRAAVAADRDARAARRQWRTAEAVALPGLLIATLAYAFIDSKGPGEAEKQAMTPEERHSHVLKMLSYSALAAVAAIVLLVMINEATRKA